MTNVAVPVTPMGASLVYFLEWPVLDASFGLAGLLHCLLRKGSGLVDGRHAGLFARLIGRHVQNLFGGRPALVRRIIKLIGDFPTARLAGIVMGPAATDKEDIARIALAISSLNL